MINKGVNLSVRATNGWSGRLDANGCPPVGVGPGNDDEAYVALAVLATLLAYLVGLLIAKLWEQVGS